MFPEVWILDLQHEKPSGKVIFIFKEDFIGEWEGERETGPKEGVKGKNP